MGRELKRVPLDFEWETNKVWCGYVNPFKIHVCKECNGTGNSKEYKELMKIWYGKDEEWVENPYREDLKYRKNAWKNNLTQEDVNVLLENGRLWDFTRVPLNDEQKEIVRKKIEDGGNSWLPFNNGYIPTADEVNIWNLKGAGHDSVNAMVCICARLEREGKPTRCFACDGSGENWQHEKAKQDHYNWEKYDPPTGEGYQLWGTTNEGTPMTPVFKTLEELAEYCEYNKISKFADFTATKEEWIKMLDDDNVHHQEGNVVFM